MMQWSRQADITYSLSRSDGLFSSTRIIGRAMDLVNGHETLFWRSATVVLSQSLTPASSPRERLVWCQESLGQLCAWSKKAFGSILCVLRSDWSLRWLDVCICTNGLRVRGSWTLSRAGFGGWSGLRPDKVHSEVQGPSAPGRVRFAPSLRMSIRNVQIQTRMRCRLSKERVAQTSRKSH